MLRDRATFRGQKSANGARAQLSPAGSPGPRRPPDCRRYPRRRAAPAAVARRAVVRQGRASRHRRARRPRPRADAAADRHRAAAAGHAAPRCSAACSSAVSRPTRRAARPSCSSAPRKSSGSTCPTMPRSICRCGWRRPTGARRAMPGWSTPCCGGWRRTATRWPPTTPRATRRTGCSRAGPRAYGAETAARHRRGQRPRAGARSHHQAGRRLLGRAPARPRAADRHRAHLGARLDHPAARLCRRRLVGAGRRRRPAGAAVRRYPRSFSGRPVRGARRQDRATGAWPAPMSPPSTARRPGSRASPKTSPGSTLQAETVAADALEWQPESANGGAFDAVLLDAPCSSTGTIRRHPDIPWLKSEADITVLTSLQQRLLDRAVALTRPGGTLVYCVCSLEPEEGEQQIEALLAREPRVKRQPVTAAEVGGCAELRHRRRRPAHPAAALARPRSALGRARRLLRRPARPGRRLIHSRTLHIGRLATLRYCVASARDCASAAELPCIANSEAGTGAGDGHIDDAGFGRGAGQALRAHRAPRIPQPARPPQCAPAHALALRLGQDRPRRHRAAGPAHRRRHPRQRNLCRPLRLRRQGRRLRPPLAVRGHAAFRRMGGGDARASPGCAICAPPIPPSPAPTRAR